MSTKILNNIKIAELLRAIAASYQLKDEKKNKFRIIAYERAADSVEHASSELKDLWDEGKLGEVAGIGESISNHLGDLFKNGHSKHFDQTLEGLPPSIFKLMELPGIGVKTAYKLVKNFKISNKSPLDDLKKLAEKGEIEKLEGFGKESQKDILDSIITESKRIKRHLLPYATQIANEVIEWLSTDKSCIRIEALGSLRRKCSTVGDIDIAVATEYPKEVLSHFVNYPKTQRVIEKGSTSSSIVVTAGVQIDLMVQSPDSFGSLLQHFTGSKHHNIALRELAMKKKLSLSEYGIKDTKSGKLLKFTNEESFYQYLGLRYIEPELREDSGEIYASLNNKLPKLIHLNEVIADLQIHSDFNIETSHDNGQSSMGEIVDKADSLGYQYLAFTEHNPSRSKHSDSQIYDLIKKKKELTDKLNASLNETRKNHMKKIFNSLEIDIMPNGEIPLPSSAMDLLDFALVSVHSSFNQEKNRMTQRILKALSHPKVKVFAHPTGRLIQKREGIEADWKVIFDFMAKKNKWVEINADPMRLDLPDFLIKEALASGVLFTFGTDSHHKDNMENMVWGVSVARRGWLESKDIINTRSLKEFNKLLNY